MDFDSATTLLFFWILADLGVGVPLLKRSAKAVEQSDWNRALRLHRWAHSPALAWSRAAVLAMGRGAHRDLARGSLLLQAGRLDEAERSLRDAIRPSRNVETCRTAGFLLELVLLERGDVEAALEEVNRQALAEPDDPACRARRVQHHAESGNWEAAERELPLLSSHPAHFDEGEARIALLRGQWSRALEAARRSRLSATQTDGLHAPGSARAAHEAGEPELASDWLRAARGDEVARLPKSYVHAVAAAVAAGRGDGALARAEIAQSLASVGRGFESAAARTLRQRLLIGALLDIPDPHGSNRIPSRMGAGRIRDAMLGLDDSRGSRLHSGSHLPRRGAAGSGFSQDRSGAPATRSRGVFWHLLGAERAPMRRAAWTMLLSAASLLPGSRAAAQSVLPAVVVAEPCAEVQPSGSYCQYFQSTGAETILFAPIGAAPTAEIWVTDGTPAGTRAVPHSQVFAAFGSAATHSGEVLFIADDFSCGWSLWATDGTAAGTRLVKDLVPGPTGSFAMKYAQMGGITYFKTQDGPRQDTGELWRTDGTTAGTYSLARCGFGLDIGALDASVVFSCGAYPDDVSDPWVSDGTAAGTMLLRDIHPSGGIGATGFIRLGDKLLFTSGDDVSGKEPWVTDGTAAGTVLLRDVNPGYSSSMWYPDTFAVDGARAFFAADDGVAGSEIWLTDGTAAGTSLVADIQPGPAGSAPDSLCTWSGRAYFVASDGVSGRELWSSDGTAAGTSLVADIMPGADGSFPTGLVATPWGVAFAANDGSTGVEPWISDGTPAGTRRLADIEPGAGGSSPAYLQMAGGRLHFTATTPGIGNEPWVSDGTPGGTLLLANLAPDGTTSAPRGLVVAGDDVHFLANDCGAAGAEPWMSDGTSAGTRLAADIAPGSDSRYVQPVGVVNGRIFGGTLSSPPELWSYDAAGGDPQRLAAIDFGFDSELPSFAITPSGMLFACEDPDLGNEPCVTDGTTAGTRVLMDIEPGARSSRPYEFASTGSSAVFAAGDFRDSTVRLFSTDLTEAGTVVLDPAPSPVPRFPGIWGDGRTTPFVGSEAATGTEPWITDGTQAGTRILADLNPGIGSTVLASASPFRGGYLLVADAGAGLEPYFTDGTPAGMVSLGDILPGPQGSFAMDMFGLYSFAMIDPGSFALFAASDGVLGQELWRTDGTPAGTRLVKDIFPGELGSAPREFMVLAPGLALFTANDGIEGREIWISDGTEAGTRLWARIAPGRGHGYPTDLVRLGNRILFIGDPGGGVELMTVAIPPEAGNCADGDDDDFDARVDCDDPDCFSDASCAGLDFDGDGAANATDCAPEDPSAFSVPSEIADLEIHRSPSGGGGVELSWPDPSVAAGSGTTVSVATADLEDLRASSWTCLATGSSAPLQDDRAGTWFYVARATNACGPVAPAGWGTNSDGVARDVSCP